MFFFCLVPAYLSVLLFALHCLRSGSILLFLAMLVTFCIFPLTLVPRRWAAKAVQVILALQTLEWLRTLAALASERMSEGRPWLPLFFIIGGVAFFTFVSILLFMTKPMRAFYVVEDAAGHEAAPQSVEQPGSPSAPEKKAPRP